MSDKPAIIIDPGSAHVKVGFVGEEGPRAIFPTVIGRPKVPGIMVGSGQRDYVVGTQAQAMSESLNLSHPIQRGAVENWEDLEKILDHVFSDELQVSPAEYNTIILQPPVTPASQREKLAQILFNRFNVPGVFIANGSACSILSAGKFTGLVVDIGADELFVVPVFDGYALPHTTLRINLAGEAVTDYLTTLLNERQDPITDTMGREIMRDLKQKKCRVALDFQRELDTLDLDGVAEPYDLPDGNVFYICNELLRAPEVLFTPSLLGKEFGGIHEQVYQSITRCDVALQPDMWRNIVVSGGGSLLPGLPNRLEKELKGLAPHMADEIRVVAITERHHGGWIGASIMGSISGFDYSWVTNGEWDQFGPDAVRWRCF